MPDSVAVQKIKKITQVLVASVKALKPNMQGRKKKKRKSTLAIRHRTIASVKRGSPEMQGEGKGHSVILHSAVCVCSLDLV